jgi:hypothetical protein
MRIWGLYSLRKGLPLSNFQPPHPVPPHPPQRKGISGPAVFGIGIATFLFGGLLATASSGGGSSELDAAKARISQLEAQLAGKGSATPTESAATAAVALPKAAAPTKAVTLSGDGEMKSKRVALKGDYSVSWKTLGSCYYSADLESGSGSGLGESVFTASDRPTSGTNNVYGLEAGNYYLDVITGPAPRCGWSATLTPIS